jgi:hypothetical protein
MLPSDVANDIFKNPKHFVCTPPISRMSSAMAAADLPWRAHMLGRNLLRKGLDSITP